MKWIYVHRLVAEAFWGPIPEGKEVNHKNGNKLDNSADNLEYVTRHENMLHAYRVLHRRPGGTRGEGFKHAKLSDCIVRSAKLRRANGESVISLAREFGVRRQYMGLVLAGKRWSHIS